MSFPQTYTVRHYTSDDSFTRLRNVPSRVKELQVALAFARDYDDDGNSTNGVFRSYWNFGRATPAVISDFKNLKLPFKVKFFLTIGGRDPRYPFSIPSDTDSWVANATESLTAIIRKYHFDGIDIYYERIIGNDFVNAMGQLIANLKNKGAITVASIAPSAPLNATHYHPLYQNCKDYIGTVVYQCHTEETPITTISGHIGLFNRIATQFYPDKKLLAGYSNLSRDWATVSVPLYFATVVLAVLKRMVFGTSIWTVSDESVTGGLVNFETQSVLELVSLAITYNEL